VRSWFVISREPGSHGLGDAGGESDGKRSKSLSHHDEAGERFHNVSFSSFHPPYTILFLVIFNFSSLCILYFAASDAFRSTTPIWVNLRTQRLSTLIFVRTLTQFTNGAFRFTTGKKEKEP
jgi:hypothetical protein